MLRTTAIAMLALLATASLAGAADLPVRTRLGAVFADEAPCVRCAPPPPVALPIPFVPWMGNSPKVAGYYGTWGDFYYTSYYGTSPLLIFSRPPYSCAWYDGHCW
jgi:hypothetical protein